MRLPPPSDPLGVLSALACLGTHVLALAASVLVLLPGCPLLPLDARAAYLARNQVPWALMWTTWTMASLSLFGFYWTLARRLQPEQPRLVRQVSILMLLALAVDVSGQVVYATMTPGLAREMLFGRAADPQLLIARFLWSERIPALLSGAIANGLYTLCGVLIAAATVRDPRFPAWLRRLGWPVWAMGLALSAATVMDAPLLVGLATGLTMGSFMLWCAAVAGAFFWQVPSPLRQAASR